MSRRIRFVGALIAVTVLYFVAGRLGLSFAYINAHVTAIWPAAGIAVGALLILGPRAWPAVFAGAFLINVVTMNAPLPALAIAAGNTVESVLAAVLTMRYAHGRRAFERAPDILRFTVLSALVAPAVGATIGTASLLLSGFAPPASTWMVWLTWWIGDATGIVLFAPVCVLWSLPQPLRRAGKLETAALAAGVSLVLYAVFGIPAVLQEDLPLAVMMVPLLLWSAFRFDARTTASLGVALCAIAVYRILQQLGPFNLGAPSMALLIVQFMVALVSLLMLSVAAENGVRRRVEGEMRLLNETLERRVAERTMELTRVYDRLVEAQSVAHVGSWEWDVGGDVIWWSDELCNIYGLTQAPRDYRAYLATLHPGDRDRTDDAMSHAMRTGQPFSFDHRIVRPDGQIRVIHARGRVEFDTAGTPTRLLGAALDITERSEAEEARAQLINEQAKLREAEESNRAKDAFLATLSHELRTPLNAALGWTHILRDSLRREGREERVVEAIYRNLLLQSRIVSDILDISRIAKGEMPLAQEQVEMRSVFETALDMLRETASARAVQVEINSAGPGAVGGDSRRLQQVAWNLLSNAVKFATEGGHVAVSVTETSDCVQCTVEDDGPGIAPSFLPHVFEQFRQADSSVTREHGGLGLGLAIAHAIVTMHQGSISAANRETGGAVFVVRLPRGAHVPERSTRPPQMQPARLVMDGPRVGS